MPIKTKISLVALTLTTLIGGCGVSSTPQSEPQLAENVQVAISESEKANALFETIFMDNVMASPISQTQLGIKKDYGKWDERGEVADAKELALTQAHLKQLKQIDVSKLDAQTSLSYGLLKQRLENEIADNKWRYYSYPVNQMYGGHSMLPSFLINQHQVSSVEDANAYISRLNGIPKYLKQLEESLEVRAQHGIIAPKFVFPHVLSDSKNIITGAPFDSGKDSALWADIKRKVDGLEIESSKKEALLKEAKQALVTQVQPAYKKLVTYLTQLETQADTRDGVWKFPQGEEFYNNALARTTTTDLTAEQIHQLGLDEVARIHNEMRGIMKKLALKAIYKLSLSLCVKISSFTIPQPMRDVMLT